MLITKELENVKKLKSVGFTNEQAETLADVIGQSHIDGQQNLKEFINNKFDSFSKELRSEMKLSMSEPEARSKSSQSGLLIIYLAIIAGFISIALATEKLLW